MPYTRAEKEIVRTFFARYSPTIKQKVQASANSRYRLPGLDEFIMIVNKYVRDPVNYVEASAARILTGTRMYINKDVITPIFEKTVEGIVPAQPPPPAAKPPLEQPDGAILANGSRDAKNKVIEKVGLSPSDAVSSVNTGRMSASTLYGDASTGVFYHRTIHSSESFYGARDDDGIHKITCIYAKYDGKFYLVGFAKHDGTENVAGRRKPTDKYKVERSLIPRLSNGDTLHFR